MQDERLREQAVAATNGTRPESAPRKDGPVYGSLTDVVPRDVEWLIEPFLPAGELVTNNADGGTGKGLISVFFAAQLTLLGKNVLFAVAEEAVDTMLVPRLLAAGADLAHVKTVAWQRQGFPDPLRIPDDVPRLEHGLADVQLLVIDPLLSHLSARVNSHTDHEVKRALQPLVDLAHRTNCTVLGNGHFGKDKTRGAVGAAQGSSAFTNTPRLAIAMAHDDEDPDIRVAEVIKSNIGQKGMGRNYQLELVSVRGMVREVPLLLDVGESTKSVNDLLLAQPDTKRVPSAQLQAAILELLGQGSCERTAMNRMLMTSIGANADSIFKYGLSKLKENGEVRCWKDGMTGVWWWELVPSKNGSTKEDGYPSSLPKPKQDSNVFDFPAKREDGHSRGDFVT